MEEKRGEVGREARREKGDHAAESGSEREARPAWGRRRRGVRLREDGPEDAGTPGERGAAVGEGSTAGGGKRKKRSDASLSGMSKPKIKIAR